MSISAMLSEDGMDQNRRLLWFIAQGARLMVKRYLQNEMIVEKIHLGLHFSGICCIFAP